MTKNNYRSPINETERLNALLKYDILDTFPEEEFDNITKLVAFICQTPVALISLIDENRQWFKSAFGFNTKEGPRNLSFCQHTILGNDIYEVTDASKDYLFKDNPFVLGGPQIRFYAGFPLTTPEGHNIGTLCVVDKVPKKLNDDQKLALATLSKHVISILELRNKNKDLETKIENYKKDALEKISLELESYKLALDETSGVIITDREGTIDFVNDETCRISKYHRDELIGQNSTIFDSDYHDSSFFENLWNTINRGKIWKNEIKNIAKDGSIYWTDTTIVPFLNEKSKPFKYVSIKRDITKQKHEESRLDQFFSLSLDYFCVANTKGYFEKISPAFSNELGFTNDELLSMPFFEFIHDDDVLNTQNEINKLANGKNSVNFDVRFKCKNGDFKLLSWNATPDRESGVLYATARDITNISKVHEENRRLSLVAKGTNNIVVITDKHRKIEWVNQAFETLTGYHLDEVIGLSPGSFLQFEETNVEVIKEIREALNNECAFNGEILNISKKGSKYWLELSISPVFNDKGELINFIAVESDVTEKKKKDSSIINLIETQNSIFNGVGHAVMFTNTFGIIQRINKAGLKLIGYTENEVIGRMNLLNFFDLSEVVKRSSELSVELGEKIEPGFNTFIAKTKGKSTVDANEWTYIAKDGKRIPVWMSITCIKNTDGAILGYFSAAEDYTTKKQVELDLIRAKDLAEQAAHAKDSFLANMSHEIRTPLNAIIGFTELLSQNNLDPTQRDYVNNINTAGDNLLLIINDILDISKIESGQLVIESNAINLKSTLKHVYDLLKVKADQKNLEFNLFLDADMPEFVMGDKGRINQIMMNLAGNSLKFTEKGEVTISVKKMRETENTITLRFSIKDTGIGIPEDKLGSIFERFTQAESSTTRKFGGTGLGLNIVKQLVELQNGQINVKSQFGHGSEFYFSLDLEKVENKEFEIINEIKKQENSLGNLSVLLCEDNLLNQHLAKKVMEKFGFELDIANNGKEGVDRLLLKDYDLILMDLQMPVMDGYQTTVYIRQILKRDIPIIAMTAHSLVGEQQKCFEIGMNAYVAKPFKQSELLDKIYSIIKKDDKKNDKRKIGNTKHIKEKRIMDFSYIDELSGGDEDFKKEIIKLFLEKVPEDIANLETAILNSDTIEIGKTTHHMKSSLSMFLLEKEVAFLVETEKDAKAAIICENLKHDFNTFKTEMNAVAEILKELV